MKKRKRKMERECDQDDGRWKDVNDVDVVGYAVNEEVTRGEVEGWEGQMVEKLDRFEFGMCEVVMSRGRKRADDDEVGRRVESRR